MTCKFNFFTRKTGYRVAAVFLSALFCLLFILSREAWARTPKNTGDYGVFIGSDSEDVEKISGFSTVVIDAWQLSAEDVKVLHDKGCKVYSYINVGSIEKWRSYYNDYSHLSLGTYENWEDEEWVNVADKSWQEFMTGTVAKKIAENGADGYFVDNADVYYNFPTDEIYNGLVTIMTGLRSYGKPVLINGGNDFVSRLIEEKNSALITGVNQETVFTKIKNYKKDRFGRQKKSEREFYQEYLKNCKEAGLQVYLLEYTRSRGLAKKIRAYCAENGFQYFVADSLNLEWSEKVLK